MTGFKNLLLNIKKFVIKIDEMQKVFDNIIKEENDQKELSIEEMMTRWRQLRREMIKDVLASTEIWDKVHNGVDHVISFHSVYTNDAHRVPVAVGRGNGISSLLLVPSFLADQSMW